MNQEPLCKTAGLTMEICLLPPDLISSLVMLLPSCRDARSLLSCCRAFHSLLCSPALQACWLKIWRPRECLLIASAVLSGQSLVRQLLLLSDKDREMMLKARSHVSL